jgi:hypothetical protein
MSRLQIELLLELLAGAYSGSEHSLLRNVEAVADHHWHTLERSPGRTVHEIVAHAAAAKWVYEDQAFGTGTLYWDKAINTAPADRPQLLEWLHAGHARLQASIRALEDDSLLSGPRMTHWGESVPARRVILTMIEHDLYHAGEVNHLRALLDGTDAWP